MAKLPHHPDLDRLRALAPLTVPVPAGTELARVYFRGGRYPTRWNEFRYFGPTASRFDHHMPNEHGMGQIQDRGILYVATDAATSLAEVFQAPSRSIDRARHSPWIAVFALQTDIELLDLTGKFPVRAGASMKLMSGPTRFSRNWARGFYEAYSELPGILYPSSLTNTPVIVLNERADRDDLFSPAPLFHRALNDPALLTVLINNSDDLGYRLI